MSTTSCARNVTLSSTADLDLIQGCDPTNTAITIEGFDGYLVFPNITYSPDDGDDWTAPNPTISVRDNPSLISVDLSGVHTKDASISFALDGLTPSLWNVTLSPTAAFSSLSFEYPYYIPLNVLGDTGREDDSLGIYVYMQYVSFQGLTEANYVYVADEGSVSFAADDPISLYQVALVAGGMIAYPDNVNISTLEVFNSSTDSIFFSEATDGSPRNGPDSYHDVFASMIQPGYADFTAIKSVEGVIRLIDSEYTSFDFSGLTEVVGEMEVTGNLDCTFDFRSVSIASNITMQDNNDSAVPGNMRALEQADYIHLEGRIDSMTGPNIFPQLVTAYSVTVIAENDFDCSILAQQRDDGAIGELDCRTINDTTGQENNESDQVDEPASSDSNTSSTSTTLSMEAKAGIGVGAGIAGIALVSTVLWLLWRWKQQRHQRGKSDATSKEEYEQQEYVYDTRHPHTVEPIEAGGEPRSEMLAGPYDRYDVIHGALNSYGQDSEEMITDHNRHEFDGSSKPVEMPAASSDDRGDTAVEGGKGAEEQGARGTSEPPG